MPMTYTSGFCRQCNAVRNFTCPNINILFHLIMTAFTLGLWLIVWLAIIIKNKGIKFGGWRCAECGSADVKAVNLLGEIKGIEPRIESAGEVQLAASNSSNKDTSENEKIRLQEQKNRKSRVEFEAGFWKLLDRIDTIVIWIGLIWVALAVWAAIAISKG